MSSKGGRTERELVNILDSNGFAVLRAPASGGASPRNLPDILAGNGGKFYAIEAKSSGNDRVYIDGREIEALTYFTIKFGALSRIGVRFNQEDWYFFHPNDLYITNGGNYRITKEYALSDGQTIDDLK